MKMKKFFNCDRVRTFWCASLVATVYLWNWNRHVPYRIRWSVPDLTGTFWSIHLINHSNRSGSILGINSADFGAPITGSSGWVDIGSGEVKTVLTVVCDKPVNCDTILRALTLALYGENNQARMRRCGDLGCKRCCNLRRKTLFHNLRCNTVVA